MKKKGRIGSSFDSFLKKEGIYEEVSAGAIKRVMAREKIHPVRPAPAVPDRRRKVTPPA